ncbi:hypothetical protein [Flavobacterium anhuiense]|uniref:hypothetical protein n=1 Tax=Flavobacterium anhuiense TaxID=459526 RepID=UPI003D996D85
MNIFENHKIIFAHSLPWKGEMISKTIDYKKEFSEVYHITHFPASKNLIESGKIIPQLIKDKSKLNGQDMKVVWLSPNSWNEGSLYGNVRFSYDFNELIKGKKFYSVEVMDQYSPTACRILITSKDHDQNPLLSRYDPHNIDGGPWYIDEKEQNYYRENRNIEFMFEDELKISDALTIDFVNHHPDFCNINRNTGCPDIKLKDDFTMALFTSYLISNDIKLENFSLSQNALNNDPMEIIKVLNIVLPRLNKGQSFQGNNTFTENSKTQLCKSILELFSKRNFTAAVSLSEVLNSYEDLSHSLQELFATYFELDPGELVL